MADSTPEGREPVQPAKAGAEVAEAEEPAVEEEPDVEFVLPSRRRRASDDEAEGDDDFHDAASERSAQTWTVEGQGAARAEEDDGATGTEPSVDGASEEDQHVAGVADAEEGSAEGGEAGNQEADDPEDALGRRVSRCV